MAPLFAVWKEKLVVGHANFITNASGFVQNVFFGYMGLEYAAPGCALLRPVLPAGGYGYWDEEANQGQRDWPLSWWSRLRDWI